MVVRIVEKLGFASRAWFARVDKHPLVTRFVMDLDEEATSRAEGETPLFALLPGTYDLHYEGDGCQ
jgi:hypothetical protein